MSNRLQAYLLLILASFLWGIAGPVIKTSLNTISPLHFLFWRFLLASLVTLPIFIYYLLKNPLKIQNLRKITILGLLGITVNLPLVFYGLKYTTVIEASILSSLSPIFVILGSVFFLKEAIFPQKALGISIVFLGSLLTLSNSILKSDGLNPLLFGNIFIILGGLVWTIFVILSKTWEAGIRPFHITAISFFIGAITFLPLALLENPQLKLPYENFPNIVYMAIFSSLIAYTAYEKALSKIEASDATLFDYLGPFWSIPAAMIFLGEKFETMLVISFVTIIVGIFIAEFRKKSKHIRGHHLIHHK